MMKRSDDYQGLINALERRVRELESQVCNLAILVGELAARGVPSTPQPLPWPIITCDGTQKLQTPTAPDFTALGDLSYGGTS